VELRGIGGRMDMPAYCAEQQLAPAQMQQICRQHRTQLVVAGSSVKLTESSDRDREELLALGVWAEALNIPFIRVFGGGRWGTPPTDGEYSQAGELVRWWRHERESRKWRVDLLLETHDAFSGAEPCLRLNGELSEPMLLIWDSHHTWRIGGEPPTETWNRIGSLVRHVHVKDSVDRPSARHPYSYVMPGQGQMPLTDVINLLRSKRFDGFVSLEWERKWHPYLEPIQDALQELARQPWSGITAHELVATPLSA
jgi:sugar phosphate isomerase/epimerase